MTVSPPSVSKNGVIGHYVMESCGTAQNVTPLLPLDLITAAMQRWPTPPHPSTVSPTYLSTFHRLSFCNTLMSSLLSVFFISFFNV